MALAGVLSRFSEKANSLFSSPPQFTEISHRVLTMPPPTAGGRQDVAAVAQALRSRHGEHFMVWNLSERAYNYDLFDNQVLEFKFPGYPCPPLAILIELIKSIRSWLAADPTNVAIVHCATGHVRTATVIACYLAFSGEYPSPEQALARYYQIQSLDPAAVTIPSQLRYMDYFSQVLGGFDPKDRALTLQCVVVTDMPQLTKTPPSLQIFQNSELVFCSPKNSADRLGEGTVSFPVNQTISGDVLIRSRQHVVAGPGQSGCKPKMVSVFRINLHTAFISNDLIRLSKADLDGPHRESDQPDSKMFVDLIFSTSTCSEGRNSPASPEQPGSEGLGGACSVTAEGQEEAPPSHLNVWQIARHDQTTQQPNHPQNHTSDKEYEPYAPYASRSRKASLTEDEIEAEIAGVNLSDTEPEQDHFTGLSNEELIRAVDDLPDPSPAANGGKNSMSLSNLSTGVEPVPTSPPRHDGMMKSHEHEEVEGEIGATLDCHNLGPEDEEADLGELDLELDCGTGDDELGEGEEDFDEEAWMQELEAELNS
eukprot:TRINITY_DN24317_c0_g1_i1.p1 TRINITY_DN24317_c0_g1~~TRINITY_DN24317_c0_g1_i1.p1  ORF type:complete len:538 (+),score=86.93 TRINITY_DN24317_c0_g1_i1:177-1790(+)